MKQLNTLKQTLQHSCHSTMILPSPKTTPAYRKSCFFAGQEKNPHPLPYCTNLHKRKRMSQFIIKYARYYVNATLGYGFTRAVTYDFSGTKEYFNKKSGKYETKEMILTDKLTGVVSRTCAAITVWPVMLAEDFRRLEFSITRKDALEYSATK